MKKLFILLLLTFALSANAHNCNQPNSDDFFICVVGGSGANTEKAYNEGHARSLALKTARLSAYEKMAERLRGVVIAAQMTSSNEELSESQINTMVKARLANIRIESETVTTLEDGSPWAEVILSTPRRDAKNNNNADRVILDISGLGFNNAASIKIRNALTKSLVFTTDMLPMGTTGLRYFASESELAAYGAHSPNVKTVKAVAENGEFLVSNEDAKIIRSLDFDNRAELLILNRK